MDKNNKIRTKDLTYIAIGIAALITGGIAIYQISTVIAIPGVKYIFMAPYLSLIMYILMSKIKIKNSIFFIGTVFGLIMMSMNLFMSISIILTSILTQISILVIKNQKQKAFIGATLFSGYAGLCALLISKYAIGGVFEQIPIKWIFTTSIICILFGYIGSRLGQRMFKYISSYNYTN